ADTVRHPHSTTIALSYVGGWVLGLCGASDEMMREAKRLLDLAEQHRLGAFRAFGAAFLGWALCQKGDLGTGITMLEQATDAFDAANYRMSMAGHLANLADAKRRSGRLDDAEALCARALDIIAEGGDLWLEPEVHRIRALVASDRAQDRGSVEALHPPAVECPSTLGFPALERRALVGLREFLKPMRDDAVEARIAELSAFADLDRRAAAVFARRQSVQPDA